VASEKANLIPLLLFSGALITVDEVVNGSLSPSRYFGLAAGFLFLGFIASYEPGFATALAWLFFLALLLQRGPRVLARVTRATRQTKGGTR
jgi:hypothetical protein